MIEMNELISNLDHIRFKSLDAALAFRQAYGGHLFVSKGAKCIVWFPLGWTPTAIMIAPVLHGVDGILNPNAQQTEDLRGLVNPHRVGSVAHNHFSVFYERFLQQSREALCARFTELKAESQNFLNRSSSQMADADFEADVIAQVYQYRFGRPIQKHEHGGCVAVGTPLYAAPNQGE